MNRLPVWVACIGMALALSAPASKADARTDISINLRVGDPYRGPRLVFESEPRIVVVPGTRVYYVENYDYDVYRYGSYWYYTYDGGWYRARRYGGPYVYVGYQSVPRSVAYVPVRYRRHWRDSPGQGRAYGNNRQDQGQRRVYGQNPSQGQGRADGNNKPDQGRKTRGKGHGNGNGNDNSNDNGNGNGHGRGH